MSELAVVNQSHSVVSLAPRSFAEAVEFSKMLARTSMVPPGFKGKPDDILVAIQMGAEVNLQPMQAIQNIAVINGKPAVYGDAALAICQRHPLWGGCRELLFSEIESLLQSDNPMDAYIIAHIPVEKRKMRGAVFAIHRKGEPIHVQTFTENDARDAKLWGKPGPWSQYPDRMLKMRARGFALRDKFADALRGFVTVEEAQDYDHQVRPVPVVHAAPEPVRQLNANNVVNVAAPEFVQVPVQPSIAERFEKFVTWFAGYGYSREDLHAIVDCSDEAQLTEEHMSKLRESANSIKEQRAAEEKFKADRAAAIVDKIMNENDDDVKF